MHRAFATIAIAASLALIAPVAAEACGQGTAGRGSAAELFDTAAESHAVRGIVKAITDHELIITRASRRADRLSFVLNAATARAGPIAVGALVAVRYRIEGDTRVATAVTAREDAAHVR